MGAASETQAAQTYRDQIAQGSRPFVIPDRAYDKEKGLLIGEAQPTNYRTYEML